MRWHITAIYMSIFNIIMETTKHTITYIINSILNRKVGGYNFCFISDMWCLLPRVIDLCFIKWVMFYQILRVKTIFDTAPRFRWTSFLKNVSEYTTSLFLLPSKIFSNLKKKPKNPKRRISSQNEILCSRIMHFYSLFSVTYITHSEN